VVIPLDPHQVKGVEFLTGGVARGKLLADEPGLGKTRQAIAACVARGDQTVNCAVPASAIPTWERETRMLAPQIDWRIFSFNKAHDIENRVAWCDTLIIDEAHYLKTRDSARTTLLLGDDCDGLNGAVHGAARVVAMTGTPTPNHPGEIWPIARALFPAAIHHPKRGTPYSYWEFVNRFCRVKQDYLGHMKIEPGGKNVSELRDRLAPYILRRRMNEVYPDMMPPRHSLLPVDGRLTLDSHAGEEQARVAAALAKGGVEALNEIAEHVATLRRLTGMAKVKSTADWIDDWFASGGGKLVVFAYHRDVIVALHAALEARRIRHVAGGTPGADVLFQTDPNVQVFLGQVQRDGVVITLTAARTCLLVEQSWVPGENEQAWRRIWRRGQKGLCDVRWAALEGSIDEDVAEACRRKAGTIAELWDSA